MHIVENSKHFLCMTVEVGDNKLEASQGVYKTRA